MQGNRDAWGRLGSRQWYLATGDEARQHAPGMAGVLSCWLGVFPASGSSSEASKGGLLSCWSPHTGVHTGCSGCSAVHGPVIKGGRRRSGTSATSAGHHLEQWWLG
jgi:hypothetical protein